MRTVGYKINLKLYLFNEPKNSITSCHFSKWNEAFLLEILSDFQVSIPEIGTVKAQREPPMVFLTSNNTREISDALKRRCLHLYIPFPDSDLEQKIIHARVPEIPPELRKQLVDFIHELRNLDLKKVPAISETIDWQTDYQV